VDATEEKALALQEKYPEVTYMRITEKGVGAAFRAGVAANTADIVGYMDIDLSSDIKHLLDMKNIFETRQGIVMVNASKQAKGAKTIGRPWIRNVTSGGLTLIMKMGLKMKASDAICGFKFFRKEYIDRLIASINSDEKGWFYIIELLIRTERRENYDGQLIYELPVIYTEVDGGHVDVVKQTMNYLKNIKKLRGKMKEEKNPV
ncbi:MAG: glycosyltransferase, partial [Parasporobacterium sp.]|nr:glycosyltransferase [Parasporobacterium sp.]